MSVPTGLDPGVAAIASPKTDGDRGNQMCGIYRLKEYGPSTW